MTDSVSLAFYVVNFFILFASLFLNSLGIYLLFAQRVSITGQNLILVNLSVLKILITITESVICVMEILGKGDTNREYQVLDIINGGLYGINDLIVITLTIDRFIATVSPLVYNINVTKKKLMTAVVISWLVGTGGIIPFFYAEYDALYDIYYKIVFLVCDGTIILLALITYGSILRALLTAKKRLSGFSRGKSERFKRRHGKFFYVAGLIIASFIMFVAIPDAVYAALVIVQEREDPMIERAVGLVWSFYLIADPLIYVFLQSQTKAKLKQLLCGNEVNAMTNGETVRTITKM